METRKGSTIIRNDEINSGIERASDVERGSADGIKGGTDGESSSGGNGNILS